MKMKGIHIPRIPRTPGEVLRPLPKTRRKFNNNYYKKILRRIGKTFND